MMLWGKELRASHKLDVTRDIQKGSGPCSIYGPVCFGSSPGIMTQRPRRHRYAPLRTQFDCVATIIYASPSVAELKCSICPSLLLVILHTHIHGQSIFFLFFNFIFVYLSTQFPARRSLLLHVTRIICYV